MSVGEIHHQECKLIRGCDVQLIGHHLDHHPFSQDLKGGWEDYRQRQLKTVSGQTIAATLVADQDH